MSKKPPESTRIEFETFRKIGTYQLRDLKQDEPSCFNQEVNVKRYRVTIEEIEEPVEVLAERLRLLWQNSRNIHDLDPIHAVAKQLGIELDWSARRRVK